MKRAKRRSRSAVRMAQQEAFSFYTSRHGGVLSVDAIPSNLILLATTTDPATALYLVAWKWMS